MGAGGGGSSLIDLWLCFVGLVAVLAALGLFFPAISCAPIQH